MREYPHGASNFPIRINQSVKNRELHTWLDGRFQPSTNRHIPSGYFTGFSAFGFSGTAETNVALASGILNAKHAGPASTL